MNDYSKQDRMFWMTLIGAFIIFISVLIMLAVVIF